MRVSDLSTPGRMNSLRKDVGSGPARRSWWRWRCRVGLVLIFALLGSACAGSDEEKSVGEAGPAVGVGSGLLGDEPLGDFDLDRLLEAARTLDPEALCPSLEAPESLDGVAEVLRIEGGCAILEYVALQGRSLSAVREQIFATDPTAHAVGLPPRDLQPDAHEQSPYDEEPPSPYDSDGYGEGDWWHLDRMDAETLWDPDGWVYDDDDGVRRQVAGWSEDVVVAVLDSGTLEHRDLTASFASTSDSWLADACHHNARTGHGTHVAGIIAAQRNNSMDVAGLAPRAQILPINVSGGNACGANISDLTEDERQAGANSDRSTGQVTASQAVRLAAEAGAKVINMSFRWHRQDAGREGEQRELDDTGNDAFEATLLAVEEAYGVVAVTSAGNCGDPGSFDAQGEHTRGPHICPHGLDTLTFPKAYNSAVISVAAITSHDDDQAVFSTANSAVDFAAPGDNILSTVAAYTAAAGHPCPQDTECHVGHKSGTSMAAPIVSAVVAHMISRYPQATPTDISLALINTAMQPNSGAFRTDEFGYGVVDPKAAIEWLDTEMRRQPDPPTDPNNTIPAVGTTDDANPISLAVGDSAQGWEGCSSQHCRHLQITLDAPAGSYNVECWSSLDPNNPWHTDTWNWPTSGFWSESGCWYGYPGEQVWVTVNGLRSDTITWPSSSEGGAPGEVPAPSTTFKPVTAGGFHSCAVRSDDTITCWGWNSYGQTDAPSGTFKTVSASRRHSCAVRSDDTITCWGSNDIGIVAPSGTFKTLDAGGDHHSCAVRSDDTITCWGSNSYGQSDAPSGTFKAVTAGGRYSCAVRSDDTITCWGHNEHGQSDAPSGTFKTLDAAGSGSHSCAVRSDDTITCWGGNNFFGQTDAPSGTFKAVTADRGHSCGLRSDDTITCWGDNEHGQSDAPSGTFKAVTAGSLHSCGLRSDDTITCWGDNDYGQSDAPSSR